MADPDSTQILYRRAAGFRERRLLQSFAKLAQATVAEGRPFDCLVTDDRELRRLNREFLGKDYAADVLAFPSGQAKEWLGEMAISADRAREQAAEHGHELVDEMCILMLHGLLHLTGLDHEKDRGRMRRIEREWREHFGLPEGLIERSRR
jgi:probable rRNA maturation factor